MVDLLTSNEKSTIKFQLEHGCCQTECCCDWKS
jgi:hypothetical protein